MRSPLWIQGLRVRLLLVVMIVTVTAAAVAAWSSAIAAGEALVRSEEQRISESTAARVTASAPQIDLPPDAAQLDLMRSLIGPNTLVSFGDRSSADGAIAELVSDALREAVANKQRLSSQRVRDDGAPWLVIGTPVLITAIDGTQSASGIEVYTATELSGVKGQIGAVGADASLAASIALPVAVLLALLAANSVLRPVRLLRDTATRLAAGDLAARSVPRGHDELADLTATVNEMAASVQRMQADAKRFTADVSHELRTPLSALTAVMEVLEDAAPGMEADARESAALAVAETRRLVLLVEDLMEVSRFDAGTATLRLETIDVGDAIRDTLRARGLLEDVTMSVPAGVLAQLDRRRLDVIVANLVGNAIKHGRPPIRLTLGSHDRSLRVEVEDAGDGIPHEALPLVFERFYKRDVARTRSAGSGLGLALALENARLHGGDLEATNRSDGGARFVLRLPYDEEGA